MRFFPIILLLPLLTGCVPFPGGYVKIWPYSSERSAEISGTLLDERTQTPVAGAEVFFTYYPKLRDTSDRNGNFKICATRYHYWTTWYGAGGEVASQYPPMSSDIMISHTNWASQRFQWDVSPKTVILQKLPEPSAIRPWMTFDGNGVVLQDGGAVRYLAPRSVMKTPNPIHFNSYKNNQLRAGFITNGVLSTINVNFTQRVFNPHLTVLRGPVSPRIGATTATGFSWSFSPRYDQPSDLIRNEDTFYVYKLEFIR